MLIFNYRVHTELNTTKQNNCRRTWNRWRNVHGLCLLLAKVRSVDVLINIWPHCCREDAWYWTADQPGGQSVRTVARAQNTTKVLCLFSYMWILKGQTTWTSTWWRQEAEWHSVSTSTGVTHLGMLLPWNSLLQLPMAPTQNTTLFVWIIREGLSK